MTFKPLKSWPITLRYPGAITEHLFGNVRGLDLEWHRETGKLSILGLSDDKLAVSIPYAKGRPYLLKEIQFYKRLFVGHNIIRADCPALAKDGIHIPLEQCDDTIIKFWLLNSCLCKVSNKSVLDDEEGERKGRGFMNLGTMLSLYTNLPRHKECREVSHVEEKTVDTGAVYKTGKRKGQPKTKKIKEAIVERACVGPCPEHNVFEYNGIDTLGPVLALPGLNYQLKLYNLESLYTLHMKLAALLQKIQDRGVPINLDYVDNTLRHEFNNDKDRAREMIRPLLGAKDISGKKTKEYFAANGINLFNTQEATIRELLEDRENTIVPDKYTRLADRKDGVEVWAREERRIAPEVWSRLEAVLAYKELGNGPDRWFGNKYLDKVSSKLAFVHPSLNFFTSTSRMMCSRPNFQNVAKRRMDRATGENIGKRVRRAVAGPEGQLLWKSDYSNAENRVFLKLAGYEVPEDVDLHTWVMEIAEIKESDAFALSLGGAREAAKSIQHAGNYLEGLSLKTPQQLRSRKMIAERAAGALIVYEDWRFEGRIVTFTGINLARRAFRSATIANRVKALEIQEKYFGRFPKVRDLQQRITHQCENERMIRPPHGYKLDSYGFAEDRIKTAAATFGSQPVAHFTKLALLNAEELDLVPILQVHDELLFLPPTSWSEKKIAGKIREAMYFETPEIPGLRLPLDISRGLNWADQEKVK